MFGFLWFKNVYVNLGEDCRNRILANLFCINNVVASSFDVFENKIVFKFFSDGVFYYYLFDLENGEDEFWHDERIVFSKIYLYNEADKILNKSFGSQIIYHVVLMLLCQDEYKFYCYLKECL